MYQKIIKFWPLLLLLSLTLLLRIYHLEKLFYFTYDEEIPAFVGRRLILYRHIPLIGGVTPFNFHLGPYFYWFYSLLLFLSKLNPTIWGYASAFLSCATTLLIFVITKSISGKKHAITAAIFWAFSFLAITYDRHLWALYWGAIISPMAIYCLYKIINGKEKFVFPLVFILALGIHADLSNLIFIALSVIVWVIYKIPIHKSTFIAFLFIPLFILPLIVFDLRHDFANTKPVNNFLEKAKNTNKPGFSFQKFEANTLLFPNALSRLTFTFGDNQIAKQYSYCKEFIVEKYNKIPPLILFASSLLLIIFSISYLISKNPIQKMISITIILYFLGVQVYGTFFQGDIFEHYITGVFPLLIIILANIVSLLPKKIWLLAITIFVLANLIKLANAKNYHGLFYKNQAVAYSVKKTSPNEFSLESLSTCWRYSGYRYLFAMQGKEPIKSYEDPNLAYLYGATSVSQKHPSTVVAIITHDFTNETESFYKKYSLYKSHELQNAIFGNIEVVIMDNSKDWFN